MGWESWENIWGIWNGITPRDGEATRRVATLERGIAPFLVSKDWEPMTPMLRYGVYASRWPLEDEALWTIVNRNEYDVEGEQIEVTGKGNLRYFDLYHGVELKAQTRPGGKLVLAFSIEAKGYGAILATNAAPDRKVQALMSTMKNLTATPPGRVPARMEGPAAADRSDPSDEACEQCAGGHGQGPSGRFSFQSFRNRD